MNYEKVVALFDTPEHAEAAKRNLESAGFPGSEISVVSNETMNSPGEPLSEPKLWYRLFGRDMERHEALVYSRTIGAGGVALTIRVPEDDAARVMGVLNAHQLVDMQARAVEQGLLPAESAQKPAAMSAAAGTVTRPIGQEQVLRLAEEQMDVGKRMVQEGTTRIRRFVTERPVEARVTLHDEHADIVRRAISDPNFLKDVDWSDKTIEVTETAEEPVVSKSARIAEEVVISSTGTDHEEIVRDSVRRQEIEVEQLPPSDTRKTGQTGTQPKTGV